MQPIKLYSLHTEVYLAAREIKALNKQDVVLIAEQPITYNII